MASYFWTCQSSPDQRWVIFHWKINDGARAGGELGVLGACHERRAPEVGLPGCGQEGKNQILGLIFNGVELGKPPAFRGREKHPLSCELPGPGEETSAHPPRKAAGVVSP